MGPEMRVSPEQKARNRARTLEAAGRLSKAQGFGTTGVDALMAASGQTTGAFYNSFGSKAAFLGALVEHELSQSMDKFAMDDPAQARRRLAAYLSPAHVENPERGCLLPTLSAEVARADPEVRARFEALLLQAQEQVAGGVGDDALAWSLLAQAVGGVMLARAVGSTACRNRILKSVRAAIDAQLEGGSEAAG